VNDRKNVFWPPRIAEIARSEGDHTQRGKSLATFKLARESADRLQGPAAPQADVRHSSTGLVNIALPRVRDFAGSPEELRLSRSNYTIGIKEHLIFPRDRRRQG